MCDFETTLTQNRLQPITRTWLEKQGVCYNKITIFVSIFGESAELTRTNLVRAARSVLNFDWLARHILTPTAFQDFETARVRAWQALLADTDTIGKDYQAAAAQALADVLGLPLEEGTSDE